MENRDNTYTPGPWSWGEAVKSNNDHFYESTIYVGEGKTRGNPFATIFLGGGGAVTSTKETVEANAILIASAPQLKADNEALKADNVKWYGAYQECLEALKKVVNWELPNTGRFWDKEETDPMSYRTVFGSNGERDYFKKIANEVIQKHTQTEIKEEIRKSDDYRDDEYYRQHNDPNYND